jgi:hypothetical protein
MHALLDSKMGLYRVTAAPIAIVGIHLVAMLCAEGAVMPVGAEPPLKPTLWVFCCHGRTLQQRPQQCRTAQSGS